MTVMQAPHAGKAAIAALLLTALLWSTGGIGFRLLTMQNGLAVSGYRSLIAVIFFILVFRTLPKFETQRFFLAGVVAHSGATTFFVVANMLTTAANAVVLQFSAPIFACLYLYFVAKKPLMRRDVVAVALIFTGICIFMFDSLTVQLSFDATIGNLIALLSGVSFGMQAVWLKQTHSPKNAIIFGGMLNVVIALPFMVQNPIPTFFDLGVLIYLGTFQVGLSYLLYAYAVPKVSPLELLLIPAMEPILNPIWVAVFDGQMPTVLSKVGGVIIVCSVVVWSAFKKDT